MSRIPEERPDAVGPRPGAWDGVPIRVAGRVQADALCRAVVYSAPDAIVVIDAGGCIILANAQTERLFGYASDELLGGPVELLLPERLRDAHVAHRATYHASPRTGSMGAG